ncbi:hypothetical protein DH2020_022302 [Rehmannia glutinosa]|uniref:Arginyl-tRNA--protein transferase n=1 Tax=Rehmannia glutinosa TaxID=99300 RepID=A0ABR0WGS3_REHGL
MAEAKKMKSEASTSGGGGGNDMRPESVVVDVGRRKSTCGYCKSGARTSISHVQNTCHERNILGLLVTYAVLKSELIYISLRPQSCKGLWAHSLTLSLIEAGEDLAVSCTNLTWKTCCPSYTIRLKVSDFVPSKEQVRVSKRMQRFLDGTLDAKKTDKLTDELNTSGERCSIANSLDTNSSAMESSAVDCEGMNKAEEIMHLLSDQIDKTVQLCIKSGEFSSGIQFPKASIKKVTPAKRKLQAEKSEELIFSCNIAFQIAATLKRLKKDVEHVKPSEHGSGGNEHSSELSPKMIAEILTSHLKHLAESCGLSVRACNGHMNFYSAMKQTDLIEVGKGTIPETSTAASGGNESNDRHLKRSSVGHHGQCRRFEIRLKRSSFDYEEYSLYRKYQLRVHNDTPDHVSESSYKRFLVDTPLVHIPPNDDDAVPPCGFGSFHQHKMRYKAAYRPSELLCPLRYEWVPYDIAKPLLDRRKYVVLSDCATLPNGESLPQDGLASHTEELQNEFAQETSNDVIVNEDEMAELDSDCSDDESDSEASGASTMASEDANLSTVLIGVRGARLRYKDLRHAFDPSQRKFIQSQLQRYAKVVGTELSEQMVYSLG